MSTASKIRVDVSEGTIIGNQESLPNGPPYYSFLSIPYAKPPIGKLRFQPPQPLETFPTNPLDCTEERDVCSQKDLFTSELIGSEDCLFLNVFTPIEPTSATSGTATRKLPVMIWIHGGGFVYGSGSRAYYSPEFLLQEDVIVVTMNYRLGALGFLYLPNAGIYGNVALKDQLMAIKWVNKNIERFGGDPNNVTLFGESAGGSSVQLHALSKNSKKYFHKAICQSGNAISEWIWQTYPEKKARILAKLTGCESTNDKEILDHLLKVDPGDLVNKSLYTLEKIDRHRGIPIPFKVVLEEDGPDAIVTKLSTDELKNPNAIQIPFINGYNSAEGQVNLIYFGTRLKEFEDTMHLSLTRSLNVEDGGPAAQAVVKELKEFYFKNKPVTKESLSNMAELLGDYNFVIPAAQCVEILARNQHRCTQYMYRFAYDGDLNLYKKFFRLKLKGASHGDEISYLFNMRLANITVPENSEAGQVRKKMCRLWANFAKYGNPTPTDDPLLNVKWEPVKHITDPTAEFDVDYLHIDYILKMEKNPELERMKFWKRMFKTYNDDFLKPKL